MELWKRYILYALGIAAGMSIAWAICDFEKDKRKTGDLINAKERIKTCGDISHNCGCDGNGKACKAEEVPGRLIPVPRVISAGCGLAWAAPLEAIEQIKHVMQEKGIEREELHECMV